MTRTKKLELLFPDKIEINRLFLNEKCCICQYNVGVVVDPSPPRISLIDSCSHSYHCDCLSEWALRENTCPQCKQRFKHIASYSITGDLDKVCRTDKKDQRDFIACEKCKSGRHPESLIFCDGFENSCDRVYHLDCVGLKRIPIGYWFCAHCSDAGLDSRVDEDGNPRARRHRRTVAPRIRQRRRNRDLDENNDESNFPSSIPTTQQSRGRVNFETNRFPTVRAQRTRNQQQQQQQLSNSASHAISQRVNNECEVPDSLQTDVTPSAVENDADHHLSTSFINPSLGGQIQEQLSVKMSQSLSSSMFMYSGCEEGNIQRGSNDPTAGMLMPSRLEDGCKRERSNSSFSSSPSDVIVLPMTTRTLRPVFINHPSSSSQRNHQCHIPNVKNELRDERGGCNLYSQTIDLTSQDGQETQQQVAFTELILTPNDNFTRNQTSLLRRRDDNVDDEEGCFSSSLLSSSEDDTKMIRLDDLVAEQDRKRQNLFEVLQKRRRHIMSRNNLSNLIPRGFGASGPSFTLEQKINQQQLQLQQQMQVGAGTTLIASTRPVFFSKVQMNGKAANESHPKSSKPKTKAGTTNLFLVGHSRVSSIESPFEDELIEDFIMRHPSAAKKEARDYLDVDLVKQMGLPPVQPGDAEWESLNHALGLETRLPCFVKRERLIEKFNLHKAKIREEEQQQAKNSQFVEDFARTVRENHKRLKESDLNEDFMKKSQTFGTFNNASELSNLKKISFLDRTTNNEQGEHFKIDFNGLPVIQKSAVKLEGISVPMKQRRKSTLVSSDAPCIVGMHNQLSMLNKISNPMVFNSSSKIGLANNYIQNGKNAATNGGIKDLHPSNTGPRHSVVDMMMMKMKKFEQPNGSSKILNSNIHSTNNLSNCSKVTLPLNDRNTRSNIRSPLNNCKDHIQNYKSTYAEPIVKHPSPIEVQNKNSFNNTSSAASCINKNSIPNNLLLPPPAIMNDILHKVDEKVAGKGVSPARLSPLSRKGSLCLKINLKSSKFMMNKAMKNNTNETNNLTMSDHHFDKTLISANNAATSVLNSLGKEISENRITKPTYKMIDILKEEGEVTLTPLFDDIPEINFAKNNIPTVKNDEHNNCNILNDNILTSPPMGINFNTDTNFLKIPLKSKDATDEIIKNRQSKIECDNGEDFIIFTVKAAAHKYLLHLQTPLQTNVSSDLTQEQHKQLKEGAKEYWKQKFRSACKSTHTEVREKFGNKGYSLEEKRIKVKDFINIQMQQKAMEAELEQKRALLKQGG